MITHREAEILTSSRQDAPLDPVVERELQAHLATCDECRAFAAATERLTAGIQALPSVPVNPRIRREVMEKVKAGRNPLARLFAGIGGGFQTGPILAAAATLVIIGLFGWMALDRMVFDDGGNDNNQIAAVPTEAPVDLTVANATETAIPTETAAPTETEIPVEPTATTMPEPTSTSVPEPTATSEPDPTATNEPEPTATTVPAPTATTVPAPTATDAPEDLTTLSAPVETATTMPEPTSTTAPAPTATTAPLPTATTTPVPTATTAPEPTETPGIEPMDGQSVVDAVEASQITDGEAGAPIEPGGDEVATNEATGSAGDGSLIEPIDGQGGDSETNGEIVESTPDDVSVDSESDSTQSLIDVSERYTGIDGDPAGKLGLTPQGRLEFMAVPDGASMTTPDGFRLQMAETQPGVVNLCGDGYCDPTLETPGDEGWQGDVPLGVIGDTAYFMRIFGDRTEVYSASTEGTQLFDTAVIGEFGPTSPPSAVHENDGILFAWLPSREWLEISGGSAKVYSGSYANPTNIRFAPVANQGPLFGYFSDGTLVIAPITAPDSPILTLPTDGVDFDMTPLADRVAVIRGNDIVIYDAGGNVVMVYEGGDMQPVSVIWLNGGIVFVDRNTGNLYQIPETAT